VLLQTISFVDRTGASSSATRDGSSVLQQFGSQNSGTRGDASPCSTPQPCRRRRLQRLADSIRSVLDRADVSDVLTGRTPVVANATAASTKADKHAADAHKPDDEDSSSDPELVVPPEGVEDEAGAPQFDNDASVDQQYFSCSEDSDEDQPRPLSTKSLPNSRRLTVNQSSTTATGTGGTGTSSGSGASFQQRSNALPRGDGDHKWSKFDESGFNLRSANYLKDRKKQPAGQQMLEVVSVDMFLIGESGPMLQSTAHPDSGFAAARQSGDSRFLVAINFIFPPYQAVMLAAVDPNAEWLAHGPDGTPQARTWNRFLAMSTEEMRSSFKLIMSVEEGPWIVRRAVPKKPVLPGHQLKLQAHHDPGNYLELVLDVSGGKTEQMATGMVMKSLKSMRLGQMLLIESKHEDELPETPLLCLGMQRVDTSALLTAA